MFCQIRWFVERLLLALHILSVPEVVFKALRDWEDDRDDIYSIPGVVIDDAWDLSDGFPDVEDQLDGNSCVAEAAVAVMEYMNLKAGNPHVDLSPLFVWFNGRSYECDQSRNMGMTSRTGVKMLKKFGVCTEELFPYTASSYFMKPSDAAYADAATRKINSYARVESLKDVEVAIRSGRPVIAALTVTDNFKQVGEDGVLPYPNGFPYGGHEVVLCGYDRNKQLVKALNSWGKGWGVNGYFYIPYALFTEPYNVVMDMWIID